EDTAALPRAFLVSRAVSLPDSPSVLSRLSAPDFDPRSEVLLEEQVSTPQSNATLSSGRASITDYQDQRVKVETDSGEPDFLFLGDSYYPGWRAYVDGQEAHIYVADYLFRAVSLPAGPHTVEFRYEPESFRLGLWVSGFVAGATVLLVAGVWMVGRRRGRQGVQRDACSSAGV
ncbi:MAG: YfhO family protein, partial [Dehalococcoidia bacterium]|nr:YfhO family protein [Dehalococcoidia bacterium]